MEQTLSDLQETVELLTLDKEQLLLDKELLEEQLHQAQEELEQVRNAPPSVISTVTSVDSAELARLREENAKLLDALRRLNDINAENSAILEEQKLELEIMGPELEELRAYKQSTVAEVEELKQTVDSMSSFESMIENLTNENLELTSALADAKQTISQLEDTIELNEELDHQQRMQIDEDRRTIDSLQVTISNFEQVLSEKDAAAYELQKKLDAMRQRYYGEKQEVEKLQSALSLGNQDHKQIEAKLRETVNLRVQRDDLSLEVWNLRGQLTQSYLQRYRYQALYTRMNDFFGGTSFFIEENKLLNIEVLCVTTVSMGFETGKHLSGLFSLFQGSTLDETNALSNANVMAALQLIASMCNLLVPMQAGIIKSGLLRIRDQSRKILSDEAYQQSSAIAMQQLQQTKTTFEHVIHVAGKAAATLTKLFQPIAKEATDELAAVSSLTDKSPDDTSESASPVVVSATNRAISVSIDRHPEYIALTEVLPLLHQTVQAMKKATTVTFASKEEIGAMDADSSEVEASSVAELIESSLLALRQPESVGDDFLKGGLHVETMHLTLSGLLESILLQYTAKEGVLEVDAAVAELLRSIKIEVDDCTRLFKAYITYATSDASAATAFRTALQQGIVELLRLFRSSDTTQLSLVVPMVAEDVIPVLKRLLHAVRNLRLEGGLSSLPASTSSPIATLKYFPTTVLVSSQARGKDTQALQAQLGYVLERYWNLLLQGENELLAGTTSSTSQPQQQSQQMLSWKERVQYFRSIIMGKLDIDLDMMKTKAPFAGNAAQAAKTMTHEQVLERENKVLTKRLEMKQEELKAALHRSAELQIDFDKAQDVIRQLQQQQQQPSSSASNSVTAVSSSTDLKALGHETEGSTTSASQARLQEEIKALEEALEALDKRYEDVVRENKALKAGSSGSAPIGSNSSFSIAAGGPLGARLPPTGGKDAGNSTATHKLPRNKTALDVFEATKALVANNNNTASSAQSATNSLHSSRAPSPAVGSGTGAGAAGSAASSKAASFFSNLASGTLLTAQQQQHASSSSALVAPSAGEQHLLVQLKYWKQIALRRLTASLRPLPVLSSTVDASNDSNDVTLVTSSVLNETEKQAGAESSMTSQIEWAVPKVAGGAADLSSAYHRLRLTRVQRATVTSLATAAAVGEGSQSTVRRSQVDNTTLSHMLYRIRALQQ